MAKSKVDGARGKRRKSVVLRDRNEEQRRKVKLINYTHKTLPKSKISCPKQEWGFGKMLNMVLIEKIRRDLEDSHTKIF